MTINLNTAPYYDDFTKSSNYYRILFKPGRSVQARELTQLQSILQNQVEQFGRHIFKDGTIISGAESFTGNGIYLKVSSINTSLDAYSGYTIVGNTSGAKGKVEIANSSVTINGTTYAAVFHVSLLYGVFQKGENFTITETGASGKLDTSDSFSGVTTFYSITEGVFFTEGHFVYCEPQIVVASPTLKSSPSARIGLKVNVSIVDSDEDSSLLDPAVNSSNYFAPGADRLAIDLVLTSYEYDSTVEGSDELTLENFIEIANIRNGLLIRQVVNTEYNVLQDALARRTYDESGDYTTRPFTLKVRDHLYGDNTKLSLEISPGKAYVRGYEFETTSPSYITIDRARDTNSINNAPITMNYGRYVPVSNIVGVFNVNTGNIVTLHKNTFDTVNVTSNSAFWSTVIGYARPRYIEWAESGNIYNLYLYDVNMLSGNLFSNVKSILEANTVNIISASNISSRANVSGVAALTSSADDSLLFKLSYGYIKELADISYTSVKRLSGSFSTPSSGYSNATVSLSEGIFLGTAGSLLSSTVRKQNFIVINNSTGELYDLSAPTVSIKINSPATTADISIPSASSFTGTVLATVQNTTQPRTKTLTTANVKVEFGSNLSYINLGYPDVYRIVDIVDYQGNSYVGRYSLDNGQRDDYYDFATVRLVTGATEPNVYPSGNVTVSFEYFSHSGTSGYFAVNSYTSSGVTYSEVPSYTTTQGFTYNLNDVIDFRPVRSTSANTLIVTNELVKPDSIFTTDYQYYLPRKDKLILNKERRFKVAKGIPDLVPSLPSDDPDGMTLFTINLPAYTAKPADVSTGFVDHRRYTMRDIGKIERRVDRIEYYTALNLLEKIASDESIPSDIPGIDRFKSGIVVDPFTGFSVSDVNSLDYKCAIDQQHNVLRPRNSTQSIQYTFNTTGSSSFKKHGDIITLDYTSVPYISQLEASSRMSVRPASIFNWVGRMTLEPSTDVWGDTYNNGTVYVNINGENDAFSVITPETQQTSAWSLSSGYKTVFTGVTDVSVQTSATTVTDAVAVNRGGAIQVTPTSKTTTQTQTSITRGTSQVNLSLDATATSRSISTNLGTKIVDSTIVPFMRSRVIKFFAQDMRPQTRLVASFDGADVSEYIRPAMEIIFSSNTVPLTNEFSTVTHSTTGWTGEVIGKRRDRIYVIPDTSMSPVVSGNVITFETFGTATVANVSYPTEIVTNEIGDTAGVFVLPNNESLRFNMGERKFRLADSFNDTFVTTASETSYLAYGIANTKEDTIISTRYNLINIRPSLETTTSASTQTNTTQSTGPATTGTGWALNLATQPLQTILCSQTPSSTGTPGIYSFRVYLGNAMGQGNVVCTAGTTPTKFTLEYGGNVRTTSTFTSLAASANTDSQNNILRGLNLETINLYNQSSIKLPFYKQKIGSVDEYAILTVTSPFAGTNWSFNVECPTYLPPPAPGTASLTHYVTTPYPVSFYQGDDYASTTLVSSGAVSVNYYFSITNTANPGYTFIGSDKNIVVTGISASLSGATAGVTVTPVSPGADTSVNVLNAGSTWSYYTQQNSQLVYRQNYNTSNKVLAPGQTLYFYVTVTKPLNDVINGTLVVTPTIKGPTSSGSTVACNSVQIPISTSAGRAYVEPYAYLYNFWDGGGGDGTGAANDPLSQTFFVDSAVDPNGIFMSSIDLWFYSKDATLPMAIEIRPTVNGYPSGKEIIPSAIARVENALINASTTFNESNYTRFNFRTPIYLPPGEYAIVFNGKSTEFFLYTAVMGQTSLKNNNTISKQPYVGQLFKSQNARSWIPVENEHVTFRINRCNFSNTKAIVNLTAVPLSSDTVYDVLYPTGDLLKFTDTTVDIFYKVTSNASTTLSSFSPAVLDTDVYLSERMKVRAGTGSDLPLKVELQTFDSKISPVLDLNRLHTVLVTNIVNNDSSGEDQYTGGNALARYITKKVTLNQGFAATDLKVYLNAYCPKNSQIKVYYKVSAPGTSDVDTQNKFVEFDSVTINGDQRTQYAEYTIGNLSEKCIPDGTTFSTFMIKIVLLSDDPVYTPFVRDLRVIAVED